MLDENFDLQDNFCKTKELDDAWNNINFHKEILSFFATLLGWKLEYNIDNVGEEESNEEDFINPENNENDEGETGKATCSTVPTRSMKKQKVYALYQILYYLVHNDRRCTPLHIIGAEAIHSTCKSKTLITSFNHFGLAMSYDELLRYYNYMASYVVESHDTDICQAILIQTL